MQWPCPWQQNTNPLVVPTGFLRSPIQIQSPATGTDASGGPTTTTWNEVLSALAGILTVSSREVFQAQQFTAQVTHRVTLRWPGEIGIAPGMRVIYSTHVYIIQAMENVQQRNRVLHLMCLELDGGQ